MLEDSVHEAESYVSGNGWDYTDLQIDANDVAGQLSKHLDNGWECLAMAPYAFSPDRVVTTYMVVLRRRQPMHFE